LERDHRPHDEPPPRAQHPPPKETTKDRSAGSLYVSGSGTLVRALIDDGLVDELHLFVFPLVLGSGRRLFPDGGAAIKLALAGTESYDSGVVHLAYQLSGER
jgi:dihydrofolate reductase